MNTNTDQPFFPDEKLLQELANRLFREMKHIAPCRLSVTMLPLTNRRLTLEILHHSIRFPVEFLNRISQASEFLLLQAVQVFHPVR